MSHLLDVNLLLACGWTSHRDHRRANKWLHSQATFATAPLTQMGYLRVSMSPGYGASFDDAKNTLIDITHLPAHRFLEDKVRFDTLPDLTSHREITDAHLVRLAAGHGLILATLDDRLCKAPWAAGLAENPLSAR